MSGELRLGFIPLADCAPLLAALEKGFFRDEGLQVSLAREVSWANIRDKVQAGLLDGAHMLGPMALAASLGAGGQRMPLLAPMALNRNGSAIAVSTGLAAQMREVDPDGMEARPRTAQALARLIAARSRRGEPPLVFATVFPFSMHNYELRYWLAAAGVDPDRDVRIVIVPPPRIAARMRAGDIDGCCVGAPWTEVSEAEGTSEAMITASEFWNGGPDKVLGVTAEWAEADPARLQAVLRALIRAAAWSDAPENRDELVSILARPDRVDADEAVLRGSMTSILFHSGAAGFPWVSQGAWFVSQMIRWGQVEMDVDPLAAARAVYRPDLFREAAAATGAPAPFADVKREGAHRAAWTLPTSRGDIDVGADAIFDGHAFEAHEARAYAQSFAIRRRAEPAAPSA